MCINRKTGKHGLVQDRYAAVRENLLGSRRAKNRIILIMQLARFKAQKVREDSPLCSSDGIVARLSPC